MAEAAGAQTAENMPQPVRPGRGGTDHGPRNLMRDQENPDLLVPPSTDSGTLPNLRFSFSDAPMRLETGGWTRQVTTRELGVAKAMAGVNKALPLPALLRMQRFCPIAANVFAVSDRYTKTPSAVIR